MRAVVLVAVRGAQMGAERAARMERATAVGRVWASSVGSLGGGEAMALEEERSVTEVALEVPAVEATRAMVVCRVVTGPAAGAVAWMATEVVMGG